MLPSELASQKEYTEYQITAKEILHDISKEVNKKIDQIKWYDFKYLLEHKYSVIVAPYDKFSGPIAGILAGSLEYTPEGSVIGYNSTIAQVPGRRHNTIVHEGIHFLCDARKGHHSQSFSDLITRGNYSVSEKVQESRAEYITSLIMCNDEALMGCMLKHPTFDDFCSQFEMSKGAAWTRIFNYLFYTFGLPEHRSRILASAYKDGESADRKSFACVLIAHQRSFWQFMSHNTNFSVSQYEKLYASWNIKPKGNSHFWQLQNLIDDLYSENGKRCSICKTTFFGSKEYCQICGGQLVDCSAINKGREYQMTDNISIYKNHSCMVCPHCGIENISESRVCQYCGAFLQNICTGISPTKYKNLVLNTATHWDPDDKWLLEFSELDAYHNMIPGELIRSHVLTNADLADWSDYPHQKLEFLSSYARFCPDCGSISSFLLQKILPMVNKHGIIES